jgi:hypothetical protein
MSNARPESMSFVAGVLAALLTGGAACSGTSRADVADAAMNEASVDAAPARDPAYWPFASDSPWNMPLGSGAAYDSPSSTASQNLQTQINPAHANAYQYSIPIYIAAASDPTITVDSSNSNQPPYSNVTVSFQAPADVAPSPGTDGSAVIISPDHLTSFEFWRFTGGPTVFSASYYVKSDLTADGWSGGIHAAGCSGAGGLIRAGELAALQIPHAIALALDAGQLAVGPVWPAISQDGDASTSYMGLVHIGQLVAIPSVVDVGALGLTPSGVAVAHALQDYGAYIVDRSVGLTFDVEPAAEMSQVDDLQTDAPTLEGQMVLITNNTSSSIGGGGDTRRAPPAPPLD